MTIARFGTTARWSDMTLFGRTIYLVEVASTVDGDLQTQTREIFASIEKQLNSVGSNIAQMLMVTIYLTDIREIDTFNTLWDAWIPPGTAPVRACVEARLAKPGYKVELQVVAALTDSPTA